MQILSHPLVAIVSLLGLLVFIHELGHFLVGKLFGIGVETFSIGMGPKLLHFSFKGTDFRISWLPLGGYVKFAGGIATEEVPERFRGKELYNASTTAQACTALAGPLANLLLAALVYSFLGFKGIEQPAPLIGHVRSESPAYLAGLKAGDRVLRINSKEIKNWNELQDSISMAPAQKIHIEVLRREKHLSFDLIPESVMLEGMTGKQEQRGRIGIGYGLLNPVISLVAGKSPARESKLETGQIIEKVVLGSQDFVIKTWEDWLDALSKSFQQKASHLTLELVSNDTRKFKIIISTDLWYQKFTSSSPDPTQLSLTLGLTDGQLTLATVESPTDTVLKTGDRIFSFDSKEIQDIFGLSEALQKNEKQEATIKVYRGDQILTLQVNLKPIDVQKPAGKFTAYTLPVTFIGTLFPPEPAIEIYPNPIDAAEYGFKTMLEQSKMLVHVVGGLFSGDVPLKSLGGPILIAKVAGDSAKLGLQTFLTSLALISINLGVLNLIPIPALDGGRLVIVGLEAIMRRKLKPAAIENFQKIGFVMLLSLVVLSTFNDLSRFWSSILKSVVGLFQ